MKSTKKQIHPAIPEYPKMMSYRDDSFVVLFKEPFIGTVVWTEYESYKIGDSSVRWSSDPQDWKPFHGTVTLEN